MHGIVKFIALIIALAVGNIIYKTNAPAGEPKNFENTWWGKGQDPQVLDNSILSFKIDVPQNVLDDLRYRLQHARNFTKPLEGVQQQYGMNTNLLKEITTYWLNKYNWRQREKFLNKYPQFKTQIQGLNLHFLHVKPQNVPANVRVLPLLLLHGWPGSVREFYEMIPLLTTVQSDKKFVFEVIVPSLPGYGFSEAAARPGLGAPQTAVLFKNLMQKLKFSHFYIQGGDWGSTIATEMAYQFPGLVRGIHLNVCLGFSPWNNLKMLVGSLYPPLVVEKRHEHKMYPISNVLGNKLLESGYMHLQATKPDSVGVGLNDSPVGLAAYIIEKFTTWTNPEWQSLPDGGLTNKFTYDKLLDNVMIYWVTESITTSVRFYSENFNKKTNIFARSYVVSVPTACAIFEHEIFYHPPEFIKARYHQLMQVNEFPDGGHFAAFEVPETLAKDVWSAVSQFEIKYDEKK